MRVDLDLGLVGTVGQGRRSKVKVKCQKIILHQLCCFKVEVKGRVKVMDRGHRSM